ncbi:MAG: hypothetical protein GWN00_10920, partial [Aliifodinibius sp.]|nr:hypothetical protein [Fodinibius sp.]NIY25298.1 hypothetical protein [Fodinibius sp.]
MDDGTRDVPETIGDPTEIPTYTEARNDPEKAARLDEASKAFNSVMSPVTKKAPVNQSYSFSIGNQTHAIGWPIGYMVSFSYKRDFSGYNGGRSERWQLPSDVTETDSLN